MRVGICVLLVVVTARAEELTVVEVTSAYPGRSAPDVEAQVTNPIERALGQLAGIDDLWSESRAGAATIWASLPRAEALRAVQSALRAAAPTLPADLPAPPTLMEAPAAEPIVRFVVKPDVDVGALAERLAMVPGVARVFLCDPTEKRARIDPARLAARGLTIVDLVAAPIGLDDVATVENAPRADCPERRGEVRFRRGAPADARDAVLAVLPSPIEMVPAKDAELALEIVGADRKALRTAAEMLARAAAAGPEIAEVSADDAPEPTIELALDRDQAAKLGVRAEDVYTTFTAAREGVPAGGARLVIPVEPGAILSLAVPTRNGQRVPLGAVAQLRRTLAPAVLRHSGRFPAVTLRLRLRKPFSLLDALRLAVRLEWAAPADVRIRFRA